MNLSVDDGIRAARINAHLRIVPLRHEVTADQLRCVPSHNTHNSALHPSRVA